jgi:hypothetical protein
VPAAEVTAKLDQRVEAMWHKAGVAPEAPADDATFLRRVYLDLAGQVPPPLKVRAFLQDTDPRKRARLMDDLLAGEDFAEHWGRSWAEAFTGRRPIKQDAYNGAVLARYLKDSLMANRPYGDLVTELLCGEGLNEDNGPVNFLLRYDARPTNLAGAVSKQFLGLTLQCAECHDHPFAQWKKADFWGLAAYFGRIRKLESQGDDGAYAAVLETRRGELMVPDADAKPDEAGNVPKKKVMIRLPGQAEAPVPGQRRQALAAWITSDQNPYFARNLVNRVWAQLIGMPLVRSLEQPAVEAATNHPELLELLASDFRAGGQDVKRLVRIIVLSKVYQQGTGRSDSAADVQIKKLRHLARFPIRPLGVDQLYQSIIQATGYSGPEEAPDPKAAAADDEEKEESDKAVEFLGARALTVQRAQALLNSDYVHQASQSGARAVLALLGGRPGAAHVEWLFLTTLSRRPTTEESTAMLELLKQGKGRRGLEDVLWALLNSAEFNTNH